MIEQWIAEIKKKRDGEALGMILVHNGVVRATTKTGAPSAALKLLSYDRAGLGTGAGALSQPGTALRKSAPGSTKAT
jgi:hypothetical protein